MKIERGLYRIDEVAKMLTEELGYHHDIMKVATLVWLNELEVSVNKLNLKGDQVWEYLMIDDRAGQIERGMIVDETIMFSDQDIQFYINCKRGLHYCDLARKHEYIEPQPEAKEPIPRKEGKAHALVAACLEAYEGTPTSYMVLLNRAIENPPQGYKGLHIENTESEYSRRVIRWDGGSLYLKHFANEYRKQV